MTTAVATGLAFTADPRRFAAVTDQVARRIPRKPSIPTLGGLLLDIAGGVLTVSAFDYDVAARATLDVTGGSDGRAVVSGRLLAELVKTFPNKPVIAEMDGARLAVTCGATRLTLPLMPADEYPALPDMPPTIGTVDAATFAGAVARVYPASDPTGARGAAMLTGIHLRIVDGRMSVEGSDRYRAAIADLAWQPAAPGIEANILVPATVLYEAARTYAADAAITIGYHQGIGGGLVGLAGDVGSIIARLLADRYPMLSAAFPARVEQPTTVRVDGLSTALKRAQMVHELKSPVRITFNGGEAEIQSADGDTALGDAVECAHHGEPVTVGVNPEYLMDALATLHADVAELHIRDPRQKFLVTAPGDDAYRHLVMPIR